MYHYVNEPSAYLEMPCSSCYTKHYEYDLGRKYILIMMLAHSTADWVVSKIYSDGKCLKSCRIRVKYNYLLNDELNAKDLFGPVIDHCEQFILPALVIENYWSVR